MPGTGSATTRGADGGAGTVTSSQAPACTRSDLAAGCAVDQHVPGADQLGRPGPGEAEQPGQGGVEPLALQPLGDGQGAVVGHRRSIRAAARSRPRVSRRRGG